MMIKLLVLITDLDNPFGTSEAMSVENVSLVPVSQAARRIRLLAQGG